MKSHLEVLLLKLSTVDLTEETVIRVLFHFPPFITDIVRKIQAATHAYSLLTQLIEKTPHLITILQRANNPDWLTIGLDGQESVSFYRSSIFFLIETLTNF